MCEINLLYTFDTRFWKLAAVSIYSVLNSKHPDTRCTIYCMVAPHTRGRGKISKIVNGVTGARLVWLPVKKSQNPFKELDFLRWSPVIFYRLFAGRIIKDANKIIYIDSDTIVRGDLTPLYSTDLGECVIGAVPDMAMREKPDDPNGKYVKEFSEKYLNGGPYFNSGILLINLKKLNENQELLKHTKVKLKYPDQDLMNVAMVGKIKPLELKYNLAPGVEIPAHFDTQQGIAAKENPVILHFYAAKPYYYQYVPRHAYSEFYNAATAIGMRPDDFIRQETKYLARNGVGRASPGWLWPFKVHENKITLFGITIVRV